MSDHPSYVFKLPAQGMTCCHDGILRQGCQLGSRDQDGSLGFWSLAGSVRGAHPIRRRDFANVSKETARTMITPIMICWM